MIRSFMSLDYRNNLTDILNFFDIPALAERDFVLFAVVAGSLFAIFLFVLRCLFSSYRFNYRYNKITSLTGDQFEDFLADLYSKQGFAVRKIGGKGDFGVDLLVKKDGVITAVQAKRYTKNVSLDAVQQVYAGKTFYKADRAVVVTSSHFTRAARMLAEPCEVDLIDIETLDKIVSKLNKSGKFS